MEKDLKITFQGKEIDQEKFGTLLNNSKLKLLAANVERGIVMNKIPKELSEELNNYDLDPERIPLPLDINEDHDSLIRRISKIYDISIGLAREITRTTIDKINKQKEVKLNSWKKTEKFMKENIDKDIYRYSTDTNELLKEDVSKYLIADNGGFKVININIHREMSVEDIIGPILNNQTVDLDYMQLGKCELQNNHDHGCYPILKDNKLYMLYPNYIRFVQPKYYNKVRKTLIEKWNICNDSEYYSRLVNFIECTKPAWSKPIRIEYEDYEVVSCYDITQGNEGEHFEPGLLIPITTNQLKQKMINDEWFPLYDGDRLEEFYFYGVDYPELIIKSLIWEILIKDKEEK